MSDLSVGQAVERLSQITVRANIRTITRALRLALGQHRFTEMVMWAQHHLLTEDMKRVIISYQETIDLHAGVSNYLKKREEEEIEATRRSNPSK